MARPKKEKKQWTGLQANSPEFKIIKDGVASSYTVLQELENAKGEFKEIFDEVHAQTGIPRRVFNALCKWNYLGNAFEDFSKNEEMKATWETLNG